MNIPIYDFKNSIEENIKRLKDSKCRFVIMDIQTGNEYLRKQILGRLETNTEIIRVVKLIKEAGIKLIVNHTFGIPYENNMTQDMSLCLYNEIKPDIVNCQYLIYTPNAKVIEHAVKFGYLPASEAVKINQGEEIKPQKNQAGQYFYDTYAKSMIAIPLGNIVFELLPMNIIKLIVKIKAKI